MTFQNFPSVEHDWLKSEIDNRYSREKGTIVSGSTVTKTGTVLGKITASGKYDFYNPAETNGTETAAAILLFGGIDASSGDVEAILITWGAEVGRQELTWGAGVTTESHKNTAADHLKANRVLLRNMA